MGISAVDKIGQERRDLLCVNMQQSRVNIMMVIDRYISHYPFNAQICFFKPVRSTGVHSFARMSVTLEKNICFHGQSC